MTLYITYINETIINCYKISGVTKQAMFQAILDKLLGKYVQGIKDNMNMNIFNGNVSIQKISLRPEFINQLGLPVVLKYSHISKILINIPWANLKEKPTTVNVQGIYVLLALKYDDMEQETIKPAAKIKPIIERVRQQIKKKWEENKDVGKDTIVQKSIIRIVDNLVLNIDEIHIRVESIKRNWDFSFGVIIDKISSYTVNEYGQKMFYTRHFTNKEANAPLRKSLTCQRFQIYFNDKEEFFMGLQQGKDQKDIDQKIKVLLMEPFAGKITPNSSPKKPALHKAVSCIQFKQSYQMKNLSRFTFDFLLEQKLSADKKYVVEVKGQLPRLNFQVTDIQLSQMIVFLQLIYEWIIDKEKNGRRNNTFDEKTEEYFKALLLKLVKQQKVLSNELNDLYRIVTQNTIQRLQNAADNLIRDYRIEKEMKKINKVTNKEKSKQMMEKLFERLEYENKEVLELFQHIIIEVILPQLKISCVKDDHPLLEIGLNSIKTDVKLVLGKHTFVTTQVSETFVRSFSTSQVKNLVILDKPEYSAQPFIQFSFTQVKKSPPTVKAGIKKRYVMVDQQTLKNLISWVSCVQMKPPLINFLDEQINYSIHITQQIFYALFDSAQLSLNFNIAVPLIGIQLHSLLQLNFGSLEIRRESQDQYCIYVSQNQTVAVDGTQVLKFKEGNTVSLLNMKPQTVKVELQHLNIQNAPKMIKFVSEFVKNPLLKQLKKLQPIVEQEVLFQGKFTLNEFTTPQNMMLKGNYLRFFPSGESIYLLRTKMYPFLRKGRYGLIFREQVQKEVNIVLMSSQKEMDTLFETLKQHMLYICTIAQWKKYYQKFPSEIINQVSQIQSQQQNSNLIDLHINLKSADIYVGRTRLGQTLINLNEFKSLINYKEYNTDAKGEIGGLNVNLGKEKLIENLAIGVNYSYMEYMNLLINVMMFRFHIENYDVIEEIISQSAQYSLIVTNLVLNAKQHLKPEFEQTKFMLEKQVVPHNHQQDMEYLLEKKVTIQLSNIEAYLIGYKNLIRNAHIEICKYRNNPEPNVKCLLRYIILMSTITMTQVNFAIANSQIDLTLNNLSVALSFHLLLYELTAGRGNHFINSIMNLLQTRKTMIVQQTGVLQQKPLPSIKVNIRGVKGVFKLTQTEQLCTLMRNLTLTINKNGENPNMIDIDASWNKLGFIINSNVILEPISGRILISNTKQGKPISLAAQIEPIIINISLNKLIESALVIKASIERVLNLQVVKSLLFSHLNTANNPRLQKNQPRPDLQLKVSSVLVILFNHKDSQLLRLKVNSINLDTHQGRDNQIQIGIEHLNPIFKIYEPVLQKTKIITSIIQGPQALVKLEDVRFNISEELVKDIITQLKITKARVQQALRETKFHQSEEFSAQSQLEKYKKMIAGMTLPGNCYEGIQEQVKDAEKEKHQKLNVCTLYIQNSLNLEALVEIKIDDSKTQLHLKPDSPPGQVKFEVRSEYSQSYEMIEKYKRVNIKLSLIHPIFSNQSSYFSVFLHKQTYNYLPAKFQDETGLQVDSAIGLYIHQKENTSNYILEIISPFKITNTTIMSLHVNWLKGEDSGRKPLAPGESKWVNPWIPDKVTINPNSQNIYASSYQILFNQNHGLYEICLSSKTGNDSYNYCCLTIQREPFKISNTVIHGFQKISLSVIPANLFVKPTYFLINHFHNTVIVNDVECKHKQKTPLYSMFKAKNDGFFKIKFGDGSMHEVYLPKDGQTNSVQLKLKNQNYISITILRAKSLQGTNSPYANECIYHIYAQLQLLISFPKTEDITLYTSIYATKFKLKKQLQLSDMNFEHPHPTLFTGTQQALVRDRFHFTTFIHILGEYEKYLQIKGSHFHTKEVTLYPSYYGDNIQFYRPVAQDNADKDAQKNPIELIYRKYGINYEFTRITNDIIMYYVSILPKYYVLNLSSHFFNIDGQGILKYNQRIVADSDEVQIIYTDGVSKWQMLNNSMSVNLNRKKQVIFFKQILFKEHELNQAIKNKARRKPSKTLDEKQQAELLGKLKKSQSLPIQKQTGPTETVKKAQSLDLTPPQQDKTQNKVILNSTNIKIFQILKHMGSYSATTFCLKQWNEWINIHNNLNKPIIVATSYIYDGLQISIQTQVNPGSAENHPYGIQNMPQIQFYILSDDNIKHLMGKYETGMRLNDDTIELLTPTKDGQGQIVEQVDMYEARSKNGRKVIFSFKNAAFDNTTKSIKSLIIPAFLKISESLKVAIQNVNASLIAGLDSNRKQIFRLEIQNVDLILLVYPSGLYMLHVSCGCQVQVPQLRQYVFNAPSIQFYMEAVQSRFIERVTVKAPKQITVFLTDKILYDVMNIVDRIVNEFKQKSDIYYNDPNLNTKTQDNEGFYTSSLNSVSVSQIHIKVTVKKVIIEDSENQKKLRDMGLSIAEIEGSSIKLSKVDVDEPINTKHLDSITKMYVMQIIVGCLGGMNLIGNPKQFVEEIQAGAVRGKPVIGLFGGILAGTANSISKIISTVSNSVSNLSMDIEYQRQRNQLYMNQPKGFVNGVKQGGKSLFTGFKSGIVGLVQKPIIGVKQEGGLGFFKGSFEGIVGLIVKPVTGIMDATSMTIQGIRSASSSREDSQQFKGMEKPLYHKFKIIRPYDKVDQLAFNSLIRILKADENRQNQAVDLVESAILQDEHDKLTEQAVLVTTEKLYVLNFCKDTIEMEIPNEKMIATGKFLEGVVLYFQHKLSPEQNVGIYHRQGDESEIIFKIRGNVLKKERLFYTLKSFIGLYTQSKDVHNIPE